MTAEHNEIFSENIVADNIHQMIGHCLQYRGMRMRGLGINRSFTNQVLLTKAMSRLLSSSNFSKTNSHFFPFYLSLTHTFFRVSTPSSFLHHSNISRHNSLFRNQFFQVPGPISLSLKFFQVLCPSPFLHLSLKFFKS